MYWAACSRQAFRSSTTVGTIFLSENFFMTACSIGRPWLSKPGTYGTRKPNIVRDFTTKSLRILLRAVPMWIGELV